MLKSNSFNYSEKSM